MHKYTYSLESKNQNGLRVETLVSVLVSKIWS